MPKELNDWLGIGTFDNVFQSQQFATALEKFIERGDSVEDLLLRAHFRDVNHLNALIRLYRKAVHYEDDELQKTLLNHAAGYPAIGGLRIDILLQAVCGQTRQKKEQSFGGQLKSALGLGEKKDDK